MQEQQSEKYVVIEHPRHGEKRTLNWVAEALLKKGWVLVEEKRKTTIKKEKSDGNVNKYGGNLCGSE